MLRKIAYSFVLVFFCWVLPANAAFTHYTTFTVQSGQVTGTLTNFPVLLKPTDNRFRTTTGGLGHVANANGFDLRPFANSDCSTGPLDFELVPGTYDSASGTFEMWVRVPLLAVGSTIYLCYGDSAFTSNGTSTTTWDSSFRGVFHLSNGTTLNVANSSQTAISPTASGGMFPVSVGQIDGAGAGSTNNYIDLGTVSGLNINGDFTVSSWIKTAATSGEVIIGGYLGTSPYNGYGLAVSTDIPKRLGVWVGDLTGGWRSSSSDIADNTWHYAVATYLVSLSELRFYKDGILDGSLTTSTPNLNHNGNRKLFNEPGATGTWSGSADEIRITAGVRAPEWIAAEYNNQFAPSSFYAMNSEVTLGTSGGGIPLLLRIGL